jgi:hypothetical protein
MLEVTADETRLRMALCNMLLNCVKALLVELELVLDDLSVKWFWAFAWFNSTGPLSGLPPNDGFTGVYTSSLACRPCDTNGSRARPRKTVDKHFM